MLCAHTKKIIESGRKNAGWIIRQNVIATYNSSSCWKLDTFIDVFMWAPDSIHNIEFPDKSVKCSSCICPFTWKRLPWNSPVKSIHWNKRQSYEYFEKVDKDNFQRLWWQVGERQLNLQPPLAVIMEQLAFSIGNKGAGSSQMIIMSMKHKNSKI